MPELIITAYGCGHIAALKEGNRFTEIHTQKYNPCQVGDIVIAKVNNIVKNLNAAFISYGHEQTGYLELDREADFVYTKQARMSRATIGDEILVQMSREPVKTKLPVFTGCFNLTGQCAVLIHGDAGISFSRKIYDQDFRKLVQARLEDTQLLPENCGLIIRTNAASLGPDAVCEEVRKLSEEHERLAQIAPYRSVFSKLYEEPHPFAKLIRDYPVSETLDIVTDDTAMYEHLKKVLPEFNIRLFEEPDVSLRTVYGIPTALKEATAKNVWLKSGAYLVIEPTEALTVIDVNTGRSIENKNKEQHFLKINLEAAKEIALQMRLRNLCGIVMVDFIDMKEEESYDTLKSCIRAELKKDRTKATFVDITALGLAELTRKRVTRPLSESLDELNMN